MLRSKGENFRSRTRSTSLSLVSTWPGNSKNMCSSSNSADVKFKGAPGLVVGLPARSAENGRDSCREFARVERLRQVVVGAELQPEDAVKLFAPGSQHQNRSPRALSNFLENVESLLVRQHDVQHD